jgi:hypothetical protein
MALHIMDFINFGKLKQLSDSRAYTHNWGALKLKLNELFQKYAKCGLASACCKAGPSSILGSVRDPTEVLLLLSEETMRIQEDRPRRVVKDN